MHLRFPAGSKDVSLWRSVSLPRGELYCGARPKDSETGQIEVRKR